MAIAAALLADPELVVLDDPGSGSTSTLRNPCGG